MLLVSIWKKSDNKSYAQWQVLCFSSPIRKHLLLFFGSTDWLVISSLLLNIRTWKVLSKIFKAITRGTLKQKRTNDKMSLTCLAWSSGILNFKSRLLSSSLTSMFRDSLLRASVMEEQSGAWVSPCPTVSLGILRIGWTLAIKRTKTN